MGKWCRTGESWSLYECRNTCFQHICNPSKGKGDRLSHWSDCKQAGMWVFAGWASWLKLFKCYQTNKPHNFFSYSLIGCQVSASNVNTCELKWHMNNITGDTLELFFHEDACQWNHITGKCALVGSTKGVLVVLGKSDKKKNNMRVNIPRNVFFSSHPFLIITVIFMRVIPSSNSFNWTRK